MDVPLAIFCGVLALLVAVGLSGMFLFQKPGRHPQNGDDSAEAEEPVPVALTPLEREAEALTQLVARCSARTVNPHSISLFRARIGSLIGDAPRSAIMKAWRELESATLRTLALYDYGDYPVKRLRSIEMIALLRDNSVLSDAQLDVCRHLEAIRNDVFGKTNPQVSGSAAAQTVDAVDWLIDCLEEFRNSAASGRSGEAESASPK